MFTMRSMIRKVALSKLGLLVATMKKLPWTWFDHRADLPQWLTSDIGQIIVEWAVLEREIEELIRLLVDVDIRTASSSTR